MTMSSRPSNDHSGKLDPCSIVIFGATGDLTARKLIPSLYNLKKEGALPSHFLCFGFARRALSNDTFRSQMLEAVERHAGGPVDRSTWDNFASLLYYHSSPFDDPSGYLRFKQELERCELKHQINGNRVYYLSTQPRYFTTIVKHLKGQRLLEKQTLKRGQPWSRVIIEKPFGRDLSTAQQLQRELLNSLEENQIYRIDHYLGKETVQNLLFFRFGNALFENLWNHRYIQQVQITVAEKIGIGKRGHFYEEQGLVRDIMQNHMMQLLSLIAMEPPVNLSPGSIHDEKVKVLHGLRPYQEATLDQCFVRGQYGEGVIDGEQVGAYRNELHVAPDSHVETYAALKLFIDNWRWHNVPFYLRSAKRLAKQLTQIDVIFLPPPGSLFSTLYNRAEPNLLSIRIQPNEGISLSINCKSPMAVGSFYPVKMDFRYDAFFGTTPPNAYQRLLCDAMAGDNTLFAREDEVFCSWSFLTPILNALSQPPPDRFPNYTAGSWGPLAAQELLSQQQHSWMPL